MGLTSSKLETLSAPRSANHLPARRVVSIWALMRSPDERIRPCIECIDRAPAGIGLTVCARVPRRRIPRPAGRLTMTAAMMVQGGMA